MGPKKNSPQRVGMNSKSPNKGKNNNATPTKTNNTTQKTVLTPKQNGQITIVDNSNSVKFGDVSEERKDIKLEQEIKMLDEKLSKLGFQRKKIPKDGACLFRAISEQIYRTQYYHMKVRNQCVDFMSGHKDDYEPFVCVSGMPWDHYLFEMRKVYTWGGQVELQAMSLAFGVNFIIYSATTKDPLVIDNSFAKSVKLCYYGNHYDCVYDSKQFEAEVFIQGMLYDLIEGTLGILDPITQKNRQYKNVGWDCWVREMIEQEEKDAMMAKNLNEEGAWQNLSGYYKKGEDNDLGQWKVKVNKKQAKNQKPIKTKPLSPAPKQTNVDQDLSEAIRQSLMENGEEFPTLAIAPKPKVAPKPPQENVTTDQKEEQQQNDSDKTDPATQEEQQPKVNAWAKPRDWAKEEEEKKLKEQQLRKQQWLQYQQKLKQQQQQAQGEEQNGEEDQETEESSSSAPKHNSDQNGTLEQEKPKESKPSESVNNEAVRSPPIQSSPVQFVGKAQSDMQIPPSQIHVGDIAISNQAELAQNSPQKMHIPQHFAIPMHPHMMPPQFHPGFPPGAPYGQPPYMIPPGGQFVGYPNMAPPPHMMMHPMQRPPMNYPQPQSFHPTFGPAMPVPKKDK